MVGEVRLSSGLLFPIAITLAVTSPDSIRGGQRDYLRGAAANRRERARRTPGEIQRHDRSVLDANVLPDIQLGLVGKRKHANAFAVFDTAAEQAPQLGRWVVGILLRTGRGKKKMRSLARDFSSSQRARRPRLRPAHPAGLES
jgi:hypothetical protein